MQPAKNTLAIFRQPLTWILLVSLTTFSSCFRSSYRSGEGCPAMNSAAMRASYRGR
ncbi:hypothetical protein [Flaviaesturariibacter terrae]